MLPPIADRFVAGETAESALAHARSVNDRGIGAILNRLGEHYDEPGAAAEDATAYRDLLAEIDAAGLRARISVKPTQLGLDVDGATFRENLAAVLETAEATAGFVWIDMEGPATTEPTVAAAIEAAQAHPGRVGLCLQTNLRRTEDDLRRIAEAPARVRLVKGAYDPPTDGGVGGREAVSRAFVARLEEALELLDGPEQGVAIGTHDPALIDRARALAAGAGADLEVQMLMGVRESAQDELAGSVDCWQYVPYGERWFAYFTRRIGERRENVLFALRALIDW